MIWLAVLSRDGRIQDDVLIRANAAANHAMQQGIACDLSIVKYPYGVAACRNKAVDLFLRTSAERLLFVDDDVLLPVNAVTAMSVVDADITLGCYGFVRYDTKGGFTKSISVCWHDKGWATDWFDGVVNADSGGGGCMMIRRHVFERCGFPWFDWREKRTDGGIELHSEDCEFCDRAAALGMTIKAHGGVRCGHLKTLDVSKLFDKATA